MPATRASGCSPCYECRLGYGCGICLGVKLVNLLFVAFFDHASTQFESRRQRSVPYGEFVFHQDHTLQFFEAGKILINSLHHSFVETLHFRICDQIRPRSELYVVCTRPFLKGSEIWRNHDGREFTAIPEDRRHSNVRAQLKRILDRLRSDEFSAGRFDQILLAIGDREISFGIDVADVAGLEPARSPRPPSSPRYGSNSL